MANSAVQESRTGLADTVLTTWQKSVAASRNRAISSLSVMRFVISRMHPTLSLWVSSGARIPTSLWFAQAIFRLNRLPMASANFSSVESLMSSAWFSIREIADFFVRRRAAISP